MSLAARIAARTPEPPCVPEWVRRASEKRLPASWNLPLGYEGELRDPPARCRSCGAEILWAITPKGRRAPLNRDGTSHFANCPQANDWRKRA